MIGFETFVTLNNLVVVVFDRRHLLAERVGEEDVRVRVDELERVAVAGQNERLDICFGRLARQGTQHIVCLKALRHINRDVEGLHHLFDALELGRELNGRLGAAGFVVGIHVITEGPTNVERHRDMARLMLADCIEHNRRKAKNRIGWFAT